MKINIVVTDVVKDVMYTHKSVNTRVVITLLLHAYMALSTGKQRRHMINMYIKFSRLMHMRSRLAQW